MWPLTEIPP